MLNALSARAAEPSAAEKARIQKGEYLTKHVAMCVQCHTPRDESGRLLEDELFRGAMIPVEAPPWAGSGSWAFRSVDITGMMGWSDDEAVTFLTTGLRPDGTRATPPMPPFRLTVEDARAVVSYLKSLRRK